MERDNGVFTPAQTERLKQADTRGHISAGLKHSVTTEITELWGLRRLKQTKMKSFFYAA